MPDACPPVRDRGRWGRVLGWGLIVALVAAAGWSGWRAYDYRAAVREASAAGFVFVERPTPLAAIRADWHAAFQPATWTEDERRLQLPEGTDLAPLRPLLLRLDPTELIAWECRHLDALRGLTGLLVLDLTRSNVKDLTPLASLAQLQWLYLTGSDVKDLAPLAGLTRLEGLSLRGCTGVTDLAPLAGLTRLEGLSLRGCTGVVDLAPLAGLARLQELDLNSSTGLGVEAVAAFKKGHPQVQVIGTDGQEVQSQ